MSFSSENERARRQVRSEFLDFCKGWLIWLVCIGHTLQYVCYYNTGFWTDPFFKMIYIFHMPLFMGIAGYLSSKSIHRQSLLSLLPQRGLNYILPIFVWTIAYCTLKYVVKSYPSPLDFGYDILYKAFHSLWFLWGLFLSIFIVKLASFFGHYEKGVSILLFSAFLLLPDVYNAHLYKYIFPFFYVGYHLANKDSLSSIKRVNLEKALYVSFAATVVVYAIWNEQTYIYFSKMSFAFDNLYTIAFRYVGSAIMSVFVLLLLYKGYKCTPHFLKMRIVSLGKDSIFIYIISSYFFIFAEPVFGKIIWPTQNTLFFAFISLLIGTVITVCSLYAGKMGVRIPFANLLLFGKISKNKML